MAGTNYNTEFDPLDDSTMLEAIKLQSSELMDNGGNQGNSNNNPQNINQNQNQGNPQEGIEDDEFDYSTQKAEMDEFFKNQGQQDDKINYLTGNEDTPIEEDNIDDQGGNQQQEDNNEGQEGQQGQEQGGNQNEDEVYLTPNDMLDIIREEGLLYIPDDFSDELTLDDIDRFKEETYRQRDQEILNYRRSLYANDPEKLKYFDYFMYGGVDADLPKFMEMNSKINNYENYDISNEENQKAILREFYKDGLDPQNPAHMRRINNVENEVNDILENYSGLEEAQKAKDYFIKKHESMAQQEQLRVQERQRQLEEQQRLSELQEQRWHDEFNRSLSSRQWSMDKKRAILDNLYNEVYMEDGTRIPVYAAKEMMINQNPELYQVYLDWLDSFDLNSGSFKQRSADPTEVTRKIKSLINNKNKNNKSSNGHNNSNVGGGNRREQQVNRYQNLTVNPKDLI